jgi:hypothetical protein
MPGLYEVDVVGKIQEINDAIYMADSAKTPITRLVPRGKKPNQMLCEWEVQKYPDRKFTGTVDGTDVSAYTHTTPTKVQGYAMILRTEGWMVTMLTQLIRSAGVKNAQAKQAADDAVILAQMHEKQILSTVDTAVESGGTPYRSRGIGSWLSDSPQGVLPVNASFQPAAANNYTGAIASFAPSSLITMLTSMAGEKKGPVDLTAVAGIELKGQMSTWPQKSIGSDVGVSSLMAYNLDASDKKLIQAVDEFEFDAGTVRVIPSWYIACTEGTGAANAYTPKSGYFLDLTMWELCFLLGASTFEGVNAGGGPRGWHQLVSILKCLNPQGQGMVLSNS